MRTGAISTNDLRGVFAVPPLARTDNAERSIDFVQNNQIVKHIHGGGITRLIYGGNAFLYHVRLNEFAQLVEWLNCLPDDVLVIPSVGPAYGLALEQAARLRAYRFPCAMILPSNDPRDAKGLERGYREIGKQADTRLIIYLKEETSFGPDRDAGIEAVARLIDDEVCLGIKYAIVRPDPLQDPYLEALLARVDPRFVISGIGERPAVTHLRDWKLSGFTTGSGCIAPTLSQLLFLACEEGHFETALNLREHFIPLEDLRDLWGPAKVLHHATELAEIAITGTLPPYVSTLSEEQREAILPAAKKLVEIQMSGKL